MLPRLSVTVKSTIRSPTDRLLPARSPCRRDGLVVVTIFVVVVVIFFAVVVVTFFVVVVVTFFVVVVAPFPAVVVVIVVTDGWPSDEGAVVVGLSLKVMVLFTGKVVSPTTAAVVPAASVASAVESDVSAKDPVPTVELPPTIASTDEVLPCATVVDVVLTAATIPLSLSDGGWFPQAHRPISRPITKHNATILFIVPISFISGLLAL